jgi:glycosyltransferase involved in cell wall biosynthesis
VSVVLCTFDRAKLLRRAIGSVLGQTLREFELIVVDDGSTDETPGVVLDFARRDRRIVYVRQTNRGLAAARNLGIAAARAAWVTFLDSDDAYKPDHLRIRLAMAREPGVDAIFGGVELLGSKRLRYAADVERPGHKIHLSRCHIGGTLFVRRAVLSELGGFRDIAFSEDRDLMVRIEDGYRVRHCKERTYVYHLTPADRLGKLYLRGGDAAIRRLRTGAVHAA